MICFVCKISLRIIHACTHLIGEIPQHCRYFIEHGNTTCSGVTNFYSCGTSLFKRLLKIMSYHLLTNQSDINNGDTVYILLSSRVSNEYYKMLKS